MGRLMDSIFPCQNIRARRGALRSEYSIKINDNVCTDEYAQIPFSVSEDALDQKYESLEYDTSEIEAIKKDRISLASPKKWRVKLLRHLLLFLIGLFTGLAGALIDSLTKIVEVFEKSNKDWFILLPAFSWCLLNGALIFLAAVITVFVAPAAAGSGIPQVKCFLNGINVPFIMRASTMFVKGIGVMLAVAGGLFVGKEGPMIHIGAVIAAGLSQGRITCVEGSSRAFRFFRNDAEKRDFVCAGAAAGVAAAFGAPVGGLLFTLEEGASFIFQRLTWNTLFASMVSMMTFSLFRNIFNESPYRFTPGGLISFGMFENIDSYNLAELFIFILMGAFGGLIGAMFVACNRILSKYRKSCLQMPWMRVIDATFIACFTAASSFWLLLFVTNCHPLDMSSVPFPLQLTCPDGQYNALSALVFSTPSNALHSLFHDPLDASYNDLLLVFALYAFGITCITYGIAVPTGLFIPSLLLGAAWGRLFGNKLNVANPSLFPDPSKFAFIGAAAQLGGIVRMTASLTVVMMEASGNVVLGLPIILTLVPAKFVGDLFTEGIYDTHIKLNGLALLHWEPNDSCGELRAFDVMTSPVATLDPVMKVADLRRILLKNPPHHAFPVVEGLRNPAEFTHGQLVGMVTSNHIDLMLRKRIYVPLNEGATVSKLTAQDFDEAYRRHDRLKEVLLNMREEDFCRLVDFRTYMNHAPYSVIETMSMTRVFTLFRRLGLRHLSVVDSQNQLRGIITRKDLCRYRFESKGNAVRIDEMPFSTAPA